MMSVLTPKQEPITFQGYAGCDEQKTLAAPPPLSWMHRLLYKSYLSSLNICLSELGWIPMSILDLGSTDGTLLAKVGNMFLSAQKLIGVDVNPDFVEQAKETHCCKLQFKTIREKDALPFTTGQFDVVLSHGFLSTTRFQKHWVEEICRVSAEACIIAVPTPAWYKILSSFKELRDFKLGEFQPLHMLTTPIEIHQLKSWLEQEGMVIELILQPLPFTMILARKAGHSLL
jgi:hypothetical protein